MRSIEQRRFCGYCVIKENAFGLVTFYCLKRDTLHKKLKHILFALGSVRCQLRPACMCIYDVCCVDYLIRSRLRRSHMPPLSAQFLKIYTSNFYFIYLELLLIIAGSAV